MSFGKISVFVTALLTIAVIVLAVVSYVQLSEIRQMREDMASLQHIVEVENQALREKLASLQHVVEVEKQDLREELASLRAEIKELDAQDELVAIRQSIADLQMPQSILIGESMADLQYPRWSEQEPDSVLTIRRSDYGADWPFPTAEAQIGCHGGEIIVIVEGGEFMVDSVAQSPHSFLPDIEYVSLFDPSSPEMEKARQRLTEEGQSLCRHIR